MAKENSLSEVHQSVDTQQKKGFFKKLFAFMGPAYLVSVGYMDPGNWATDIAGGSRYGYALLWVLLMSNLMAMLLQSLSARLGIVAGLDLAQASRATYSKTVNFFLYILAEIAIAACDLAEVIGMAIGLSLLFDLPLIWGVVISVLDTFILLFLLNYGIKKMEAFILSLISVIGVSFLIEMFLAKPEIGAMAKGFIPSLPDESALYIAIGIIGATVMPHNLYLHSALVQSRKFGTTHNEIKKAIRFNLIDTVISLNVAFFVNAAILILAASAFYYSGMHEVAEIQDAYRFLEPLLGSNLAPILFAVALIAAGQSSTVTGTLAGQIVMEGYLNLRIQPWIRRILTRLIAIVPAVVAITYLGESATGELLIFSQVVLSLQLGFAVIPLIHFVSDKNKMGDFVISKKTQFFAWLFAGIIVALNIKLVYSEIATLISEATTYKTLLQLTIIPVCLGFVALLLYIVIKPILDKKKQTILTPHGNIELLEINTHASYSRIAITVDFSKSDSSAISRAIQQGGTKANYYLLHIVETVGASFMGSQTNDKESEQDKKELEKYRAQLLEMGINAEICLGYGNPKKAIPQLVTDLNADLLVMGAHGHKGIKDWLFGATVNHVRHQLTIPVLVVRK
jgi:manganese transport protein